MTCTAILMGYAFTAAIVTSPANRRARTTQYYRQTAEPTYSVPTPTPTTAEPTYSPPTPTTAGPTAEPTYSVPTPTPTTAEPTAEPTYSVPTPTPTTYYPTPPPNRCDGFYCDRCNTCDSASGYCVPLTNVCTGECHRRCDPATGGCVPKPDGTACSRGSCHNGECVYGR